MKQKQKHIKSFQTKQDQQKNDKNINDKLLQYFPKKPYQTQLYIAKQLYSILQKKLTKIAIVQSPTGTGKTYALLVGTLAWLKQHPNQIKSNQNQNSVNINAQNQNNQSNSLPSWLVNKVSQNKISQLVHQKQEKISKLLSISQYKQNKQKNIKTNKTNNANQAKKSNEQKIQWQIQDIEDIGFSQDQNVVKGKKRLNNNTFQLLNQKCLPKVIFVSRTHSQLGQVMQSISFMDIDLRYVSMASKDHLCVHPQIQKNRVHQKCQYLLSHGGCPYYHQQSISDFFSSKIQQAQKTGQSNSICSYFGVKNLLPISDIICVPYSSILSPQIRMRLNINIQNAIVIFDEAHNIIEQQLNIKSPQIGFTQLQMLCARIDEYKNKYGNKMMEVNMKLLSHIQQICRGFMNVISLQYQKICKFIKQNQNQQFQSAQPIKYIKLSKIQLFAKLKLAQIKVNKIKTYISLSNFDQKLVHFNTKQPFSLAIINKFIDFITMLTTNQQSSITSSNNKLLKQNNPDSTIILIKSLPNQLNKSLNNSSIKIFCMQSTQLAEISNQARLVILAGGTMQPISSFTNIFKNGGLTYQFLKGSHVIKEEQCNVYCIGGIQEKNKQKYGILFTYGQMKNKSKFIIENTCKILKTIIRKTEPNSGTVIFIQNYNLIQAISSVLGNKIQEIPVFYDSNSNTNINQNQDKTNMNVFQKYQKRIKENKSSAILVSVMGGKLSQGINFSDELARSIIVLGLPYPNLKSPEMIQKMKFLDAKLKYKLNIQKQQKLKPLFESANKKLKRQSDTSNLQQTGQSYYQNCCIRTLSQTIGRGIRHINDYANIYLIDSRFAGINHRLPTWMQKRINHIDFYQV